MAFAQVTTFPGALNQLLQSPTSGVARELAKFGVRVENRAKVMASGPHHGYYKGVTNPSAPGSPPGVRSGRLRTSIGWNLDFGGGDIKLMIGCGVYYFIYLEKGSRAPYPFLGKAIEAEGGTLSGF
jgi:hypothetical protein